MKINVLFFASLRELFEKDSIEIAKPENIKTAQDLLDFYANNEKGPWLELLAKKNTIRLAINHSVVDWDSVINDGDEIAFLPPITGG
jgi:molybdopterin synthase sulfur carrier subunit